MVAVVGSRGSSNTEMLFEIASEVCKNTIFIENAEDLAPHLENIKNHKKIAIIAGASTPGVIIQEVKQAMTETANQELSFAELLDKSFKTLNIGERVTGTILAVTPAEIKVDLGTKHTGILPVDELSADGEVDVSSFRVGDPIDAVCTKFSEVEGTVMLSKKRLDEAKNIGKVASAYESGEILHGTVKDTVKGGVIVNVGGVRVFVPAGQCGADANNLEFLRGQKVPVKIITQRSQKKGCGFHPHGEKGRTQADSRRVLLPDRNRQKDYRNRKVGYQLRRLCKHRSHRRHDSRFGNVLGTPPQSRRAVQGGGHRGSVR